MSVETVLADIVLIPLMFIFFVFIIVGVVLLAGWLLYCLLVLPECLCTTGHFLWISSKREAEELDKEWEERRRRKQKPKVEEV